MLINDTSVDEKSLDWENWIVATHSSPIHSGKSHPLDESKIIDQTLDTNGATTASTIKKQMVESEHRGYNFMNTFASNQDIQTFIGINVRCYFTFTSTMIAACTIIGSLGIILQIIHLYFLASNSNTSIGNIIMNTSPFYWLSITQTMQDSHVKQWWYALTIISLFISLIYPLLYRFIVHRIQSSSNSDSIITKNLDDLNKKPPPVSFSLQNTNNSKKIKRQVDPPFKNRQAHESRVAQVSVIIDKMTTTLDPLNIKKTLEAHRHKQYMRIFGVFISSLIFVGLLAILGYLDFSANIKYHNLRDQLLVSFGLSIGLGIFKAIFQILTYFSTFLEQHENKTSFDISLFIKTYIFKMTSIILLYSISQLTVLNTTNNNSNSTETSTNNCTDYEHVEFQTQRLAMYIVAEVVSDLFKTFISMPLHQKIVDCLIHKTRFSENTFRPEFELNNEYSNLLCKFFIVALGISTFPTIAFWMSLSLILNWFLDKIKLIKYSKPITRTTNTFSNILLLLNTINIFIAILIPPNGAFHIWSCN